MNTTRTCCLGATRTAIPPNKAARPSPPEQRERPSPSSRPNKPNGLRSKPSELVARHIPLNQGQPIQRFVQYICSFGILPNRVFNRITRLTFFDMKYPQSNKKSCCSNSSDHHALINKINANNRIDQFSLTPQFHVDRACFDCRCARQHEYGPLGRRLRRGQQFCAVEILTRYRNFDIFESQKPRNLPNFAVIIHGHC